MGPEDLRALNLRLQQASSMLGGIGILDKVAKELSKCAEEWEKDRNELKRFEMEQMTRDE